MLKIKEGLTYFNPHGIINVSNDSTENSLYEEYGNNYFELNICFIIILVLAPASKETLYHYVI